MTDNQLVNAQQAAALKKMLYSTFCYHVRKGHTPQPVPIGKRKFYSIESILNWPVPAKKRGRPRKSNE